MSLESLAGRTFAPTEPYEVTRDRVAGFAASTGGRYDGGAAPATFPIVVAFAAIRSLVDDPATGMSLERIVHGEQRFSYHRTVRPGDVLTAELTVETVRSIGDADYLRTRTEIMDQDGEQVVTAWATLIHRHAPQAEPPEVVLPPPRTGEAS
jgi:hypothetical protein